MALFDQIALGVPAVDGDQRGALGVVPDQDLLVFPTIILQDRRPPSPGFADGRR
jgi:hypothetical protein